MHATYCLNGHYVGNTEATNPRYRAAAHRLSQFAPIDAQQPAAFCKQCGKKTISECQSCQARIETLHMGVRPDYCGNCGKPYPWTELALATAKEYTDTLDLSQEDKDALKGTFDDLTTDTPRTPMATNRFMKYLGQIGPAAGDVLKKTLVEFMTAAAKSMAGL